MKKLISIAVALVLAFSLIGCGGRNSADKEMKTPKKYFTLSFDDGTTEDEKLIALLKKYNIPATFCLNTGLMNGEVSIEVAGEWRRTDFDYAKNNRIYQGFDVISHAYAHKEFTNLGDSDIVYQVKTDAEKIKELTGESPVGVAYPGGTAYYDDRVISVLLYDTDIRFARDTDDTYGFGLPENFMAWKPTCSLLDNRLMSLAEKFTSADTQEDMLFYVWDHPWAISAYNAWDKTEKFLEYMSGREDIVYVTNSEFYRLFKDDIPSKGLWD